MIRQLADPITPFRVISQPAYPPGHVHGDQGQAELRSLIHSVLGGLRPGEREVIELSFRHDLNDSDLAIVLGVSQSRAHDLASRARGRLEEALGALHIALTGREACPVLLGSGWAADRTTRAGCRAHRCQDLAHGRGAMRRRRFPARTPRSRTAEWLDLCTLPPSAVAYRGGSPPRGMGMAAWRAIRQAPSSIRANRRGSPLWRSDGWWPP